MTRWLLDTNIISHAARNPHGALAKRIEAEDDAALCTSVVVLGELRYGLRKRGSARLTASVEAVVGGITVEPLTATAGDVYGDIRAELESAGKPIGANDFWIAAHAIDLGCTLVTDDSDFDSVPGLSVENWLKAP